MTGRRHARFFALTFLLSGAFVLAPAAAGGEPLDAIRFTAWGTHELAILDRRPYFLAREELFGMPVAPPPANSAASTRAELDALLALERARTPAEERAIERHRAYAGVCDAFFAVLARSAARAPNTRTLLDHVDIDVTLAVFHAKRRFDRARPHQLEPRLKPSIPVPAHPAYPSGHAIQGRVVALVLASLVPERRAELLALGTQIGHEREIAGLHYPSDSAASAALGDAIYQHLERNVRFRAERDAARAEWPAARR